MFLAVTRAGAALRLDLREATNLRELKVVVERGVPLADAEAALTDGGEVRDDGGLWLRIAVLERMAASALPEGIDGAEWREGFAKMIAYAAAHGWVDEPRRLVAAHCEVDGAKVALGGRAVGEGAQA